MKAMNFIKKSIIFASVLSILCGCNSRESGQCLKPRTIVTCDPELDDNNSMIRFLLHATDYQIDGLVYTSSRFHWKNDGSGRTQFIANSEYDQMGLGPQTSWRFVDDERFIDDIIDAYEQCYPNLIVHDPSYPTPEYLRSVTVYGNCAFEGDYSYDSNGSELIRKNILDDGPEPLFIQAWGGCSSIAAALRSIAEDYRGTDEWDAVLEKINRKVILCLSGDQDNVYNSYIALEWPDIYVQNLGGSMGRYDNSKWNYLTSPEWTAEWMRTGPLGGLVRCWGDGKQMVPGDLTDFPGPSKGKTREEMIKEGYVVWCEIQPEGTLYSDGDSGCFYQLIDNGLRAWEDPTWGGWSGRWDIRKGEPQSGHPAYLMTDLRAIMNGTRTSISNLPALLKRGPVEEDHSFPDMYGERNLSESARMRWSVTPEYKDANHYPVLEGPMELKARAGESIAIKARCSDPDGDRVQLKWWYFPVGSYVLTNEQTLSVDSPETAKTTFKVPEDAKSGDTIHLVLQAIDDGTPSLTRYLRTVITVE